MCYKSPASTDENDDAVSSLFKSVDEFVDKHNCIIMGDFSLPNVDFGTFTVYE